MIRTKVTQLSDIPIGWPFEYYCNLDEKLIGQDVLIKSPINPNDTNPSCSIYFNEDKYWIKDYSANIQGSAIEMVMAMFNLSYRKAYKKILEDYLKSNNQGHQREYIEYNTYLNDIKFRKWVKNDADYWLQFNISSRILEYYNIRPIESFSLMKEVGGKKELLTFDRTFLMYAFCRANGEVYKIYKPKSKTTKYIMVQPGYIQGFDQLTYKKKTLIIQSGLKDMCSLKSLNILVDVVADESEAKIIKPHIITSLKEKYPNIYCLLDNDNQGQKGMSKYKELYGISPISLNLSKDVADSVRDYDKKLVKNLILKQIKL